jgi:MFS family permease
MAPQSAATIARPPENIANANRRRQWLVLAALFTVLFFTLGGTVNPLPVFLTPLIKQYGWSHARASWVPTVYLLMFGLGAPVIGWLMDRFEARIVMSVGALVAVAGMACASLTHSFLPMIGAFVLIGGGAASSTVVPGQVVAANWFSDNRGLAISVTIAGAATGGIVMPVYADYLIRHFGLSATFLVLAAPILLIAVPLIVLIIRTRPAGKVKTSVAEEVKSLPGLELGPAVRTLPFWLMVFILMMASIGLNGSFVHLVAFLITAGFSPEHAAMVAGTEAAVAVPGFLLLGVLCDRFTGRRVLPCVLVVLAAGVLLLLGTRNPHTSSIFLVLFLLCYGLTAGVTTAVIPVVLVESLGLRRFGSISGLVGLAGTVGIAGGPLLMGLIFDATGSYTRSFELGAACLIAAAVAALAVSPAQGAGAIPGDAAAAVPRAI